MTVCIAVRTRGVILLLSDRMITTGDIEFEPPTPKIIGLTSSIFSMFSGDSALYAEIIQDVMGEVRQHISAEPDNWLLVRDVAHLFQKHWSEARMRRAELEVLWPLGLNRKEFVEQSTKLPPSLLNDLVQRLGNYSVSGIEVVIAGIDQRKGSPLPSIYHIADESLMCMDQTSFVAIGSGARHAESHLMVAKYNWQTPNGDALLLAYSAKKSAEVAPGVGTETDIFVVGDALGTSYQMPADFKARLEQEYRRVQRSEEAARQEGRQAISDFLEAAVVHSGNQAAPTASTAISTSDGAK